jgi:hypothetical protein
MYRGGGKACNALITEPFESYRIISDEFAYRDCCCPAEVRPRRAECITGKLSIRISQSVRCRGTAISFGPGGINVGAAASRRRSAD